MTAQRRVNRPASTTWLGRLRPQSVVPVGLRGYRKGWLRGDLLAGLAVWAVLVPQGLAYGELAGLSPVSGLYTAMGATLLYALVGGSRYLNVGPESSVAIIVAASLGSLTVDDPDRAASTAAVLALATAGFLLLGAAARLAIVSRLLSTPILAGYLAGSAVVIAVSQLGKVAGVSLGRGEWWQQVVVLAGRMGSVDLRALLLAGVSAAIVLAIGRWWPRVPGILAAVVIATVVVAVVGWQSVVPVVGDVPAGLPVPSVPRATGGEVLDLLGAGASLALLIFASSMLTSSALAARDREAVSGTREFLGLAAANVGAAVLGGFPANGSDTRSFIVAENRGRSQVANLTAGVLTAVTLVLLTGVFPFLPQAALGAVVIVSAVRMIDPAALRRLWRVRPSDFVLAALTALGVLTVGVLPGIGLGVLISLLEVMRRAVLPPTAVLGRVEGRLVWRAVVNHEGSTTEPGVVVYRFDAPLFFANAAVLRSQVLALLDDEGTDPPVRHVVIDAEGMVDMDITGAETVDGLLDELDGRDVALSMARVRTSVLATMRRVGLEERMGSDHLHLRVHDAVRQATTTGGPDAAPASADDVDGR